MTTPGRKQRSKVQRHLDRETVARLTLQGWSQPQIATYLEVNQATVSRDLKAIQEEWKQASIRDFDLDRQRELERLRLLEKEYWSAWERSQEQRESQLTERSVVGRDAEGQPLGRVRQLTRTEQKIGDIAALNGVVKCVELRAKLLGLFPSEKTGSGSAIAFTDGQIDVLSQLMQTSTTYTSQPD